MTAKANPAHNATQARNMLGKNPATLKTLQVHGLFTNMTSVALPPMHSIHHMFDTRSKQGIVACVPDQVKEDQQSIFTANAQTYQLTTDESSLWQAHPR